MKSLNVLSLFNGMSGLKMALDKLDVKVDKYYSSEIDKFAIKASNMIYPDTIQLGSVTEWRDWNIDWKSIDLVTGGFPCQAWSVAGKQLGDKDERGMLFWEMLDIMKHVLYHNPNAKFLIENVKMKSEFEQYITTHTEKALGEVHKILINSALVSAQNRKRYYWTNFEVNQPKDKGPILADIIEDGYTDREKSHCIDANYGKGGNLKSYFLRHRRQLIFKIGTCESRNVVMNVNENNRVKDITENNRGYRPHKGDLSKSGISELGRILKTTANKTDTVTTSHMPKIALNNDVKNLKYRKLTPRECMILQTIPEHVIDLLHGVDEKGKRLLSNTQLYKMTGNGWTIDVIAHILSFAKF